MKNTTRTVISRRARPAKEPLSKALIVNTAWELLRNEGSSGMSMRKIAKALDTGPASLYVYVKNLQELNAYVLDHGLDKVVLPDPQSADWRTNLFEALHNYQQVLFEAPGVAELALTTIPIGPHSLVITEYILARLHEGGMSARTAAWGLDMLLLYATSVAFEQASRNERGNELDALSASYLSLDAAQYPMLAGAREEMTSGSMTPEGHERFRWGLDVILQGMMQKQA
ncbi:transcriptional regulator, TetR family [Paenibacillus curdlanolyticus YK9]|uniref:Transcriptional regulator, TetR family n=1 Tax=Paenibacillus curdlanolyticus YK9 TaxID=717606 RepID=E0I4H4_9BACL|nr:TetR/AcrR family transcriptional regulator C-terminal domain-containing protein [Paenibacillus curdlanolyticus]EFM12505.1 transcriptional regulator, TetR family [Paenibacillus curdlanolyticus YK9]